MEGVNPFIKNNKHRMIMFLDELGVRKLNCLLFNLQSAMQNLTCPNNYLL